MYPVTEAEEVMMVDQSEDWTGSDALRCSPVSVNVCTKAVLEDIPNPIPSAEIKID